MKKRLQLALKRLESAERDLHDVRTELEQAIRWLADPSEPTQVDWDWFAQRSKEV